MSNVVQMKRTETPGNVPAPHQMVQGELVLNSFDGKAFFKKLDGTVIEIGNAPGTVPYEIAGSCIRTGTGLILSRYVLARSVTFPAGLVGSFAVRAAPHKRGVILDLRKNGTGFGSITFNPHMTAGTFISWAEMTFDAGDVLSVTAGSDADAAVAEAAFTLVGVR